MPSVPANLMRNYKLGFVNYCKKCVSSPMKWWNVSSQWRWSRFIDQREGKLWKCGFQWGCLSQSNFTYTKWLWQIASHCQKVTYSRILGASKTTFGAIRIIPSHSCCACHSSECWAGLFWVKICVVLSARKYIKGKSRRRTTYPL
jgi:hypothetical protein